MHALSVLFQRGKTVVVFVPDDISWHERFLDHAARLVDDLDYDELNYVDIGGVGLLEGVPVDVEGYSPVQERTVLWGTTVCQGVQVDSLEGVPMRFLSPSTPFSSSKVLLVGYRAVSRDTPARGRSFVKDLVSSTRFPACTVVVVEVLEDGSVPAAFRGLEAQEGLVVVDRRG